MICHRQPGSLRLARSANKSRLTENPACVHPGPAQMTGLVSSTSLLCVMT
jgi:hypothetical protein